VISTRHPRAYDVINPNNQNLETAMLIAIISLAGLITAGLVAGACINVLLQLENIDNSP
jgi:hypothetical protein